MKYEKPPKNLDDQVALLISRGLVVDDREQAKNYLRDISYYHLSVYFKFYQENDISNVDWPMRWPWRLAIPIGFYVLRYFPVRLIRPSY